MTTPRPWARRLAPPVLLLGVVVGSATGCSGDSPDGSAGTPGDAASSGSPAEPEPVETRVRIARVDGALARDGRERLRERVGAAIDTWIDAAYGGTYPRQDFSGTFTTFTRGAAARAAADTRLMSNAAVGQRVDDVRLVRRHVDLDVLGVGGTAAGVTARVDLVLELSGEVSRTDRIRGLLHLVRERSAGSSAWRVFGYDLTRKAT